MRLEEFRKSYWNYYLELEKRMEETHRYIEYDENNYKTYSSYYLMLFQNVCSEIDVVGKEIAAHFNPAIDSESGTKPINRWWFEIQDNLPEINRQVIFSDAFPLKPWDNFRVVKSITQRNSNGKTIDVTNYNLNPKTDGITFETPKWWSAYNKAKHMRLKTDNEGVNYKKANLKNLSSAYAALYLLEFEFMKEIGSLQERLLCGKSIFFGMGDLENHYISSAFIECDDSETVAFK